MDLDKSLLTNYLLEKSASKELLDSLDKLDKPLIDFLTLLASELGPSANSINSILQIVREISLRDGTSSSEVIKAVNIQALIDTKRARKEKFSLIRQAFEQIRFPEKTRIEKEIYSLVSDIKREFNVKLELPQDLEGDILSISVNFKDPESLLENSKRLESLSSSPKLTQLFKVLKGDI